MYAFEEIVCGNNNVLVNLKVVPVLPYVIAVLWETLGEIKLKILESVTETY